MQVRYLLGMSSVLMLAACAQGSDPDDPPQTHVGTCSHYQSALRQFENVPNCEMRTRHEMINGLGPVNPGNKS